MKWNKKINYALFVICFVLMIIRLKNASYIINESPLFTILPGILIFSILLFYDLKKTLQANKNGLVKKISVVGLKFLKNLFVAYILVQSLILMPFDFFNFRKSQGNVEFVENCDIMRISSRKGRSRAIYFKYEDKIHIIRSRKTLGEVWDTKEYKNYSLLISVKKGLFKTLIIQDWEVVPKI